MHVYHLFQIYRYKEARKSRCISELNLEMYLEAMKHLAIFISMLAISSPHINFGDKNSTKILAEKVNEDAAKLVEKYPDKFGSFVSITLSNLEHSYRN